jgi:hypothetical protein
MRAKFKMLLKYIIGLTRLKLFVIITKDMEGGGCDLIAGTIAICVWGHRENP